MSCMSKGWQEKAFPACPNQEFLNQFFLDFTVHGTHGVLVGIYFLP